MEGHLRLLCSVIVGLFQAFSFGFNADQFRKLSRIMKSVCNAAGSPAFQNCLLHIKFRNSSPETQTSKHLECFPTWKAVPEAKDWIMPLDKKHADGAAAGSAVDNPAWADFPQMMLFLVLVPISHPVSALRLTSLYAQTGALRSSSLGHN